jgi:prepilin-type N-terminal cleavage/methylation domain-containing protein
MTGDKKQQGFSLIELIVVLGVFSMVITVVVGSFIIMLQAQRAILVEKDVAENARFALEYMARQMRVVNRYDGAAGQPVGCVPIDTSFDAPSANEIFFLSQADECLHFFVSNGVIKFENDLGTQDLTSSSEVFVEDLTFGVTGSTESDLLQPRVTLSITARGAGESEWADAARMTVQTTVSVRNLDVPGA